MKDESTRHELTSCKEIAAFLRISVRTAQSWERERGLPVRRLPGPRGLVSARIENLEAWKATGTGMIQAPAPGLPTSRQGEGTTVPDSAASPSHAVPAIARF